MRGRGVRCRRCPSPGGPTKDIRRLDRPLRSEERRVQPVNAPLSGEREPRPARSANSSPGAPDGGFHFPALDVAFLQAAHGGPPALPEEHTLIPRVRVLLLVSLAALVAPPESARGDPHSRFRHQASGRRPSVAGWRRPGAAAATTRVVDVHEPVGAVHAGRGAMPGDSISANDALRARRPARCRIPQVCDERSALTAPSQARHPTP